jgi:adenylate cyclase class 2
MTDQHEVEIKFYLSEPQAIRQKLIEVGAKPKGSVTENNLRFDDAARSLSERKMVLRLRRSTGKDRDEVVMAIKTLSEMELAGLSVRREIEIGIDDMDSMRAALAVLGFEMIWRYEKRRETLVWEDIKAEIDQMPFGWFLELEGEADGIRRMADRLGLELAEGITASYAALFEQVKRKMGLTMNDLTFEAFEGISVPGEIFKTG